MSSASCFPRKKTSDPQKALYWNDYEVTEWFVGIGFTDENYPVRMKVKACKMLGSSLLKMSSRLLKIEDEFEAIIFTDHLALLKSRAATVTTYETIVEAVPTNLVSTATDPKKRKRAPKPLTSVVIEQETATRSSSVTSTTSTSSESSSRSVDFAALHAVPVTPRRLPSAESADLNRVIITRQVLQENGWSCFTHKLGPCFVNRRRIDANGNDKDHNTTTFESECIKHPSMKEGTDYFYNYEDKAFEAFLEQMDGVDGKKYVMWKKSCPVPQERGPRKVREIPAKHNAASDEEEEEVNDHIERGVVSGSEDTGEEEQEQVEDISTQKDDDDFVVAKRTRVAATAVDNEQQQHDDQAALRADGREVVVIHRVKDKERPLLSADDGSARRDDAAVRTQTVVPVSREVVGGAFDGTVTTYEGEVIEILSDDEDDDEDDDEVDV